MTTSYCPQYRPYYRFNRGEAVTIISGCYKGYQGVVDSAVFQRTVDHPDEFSPGYHLILDTGPMVTVRWDYVQRLIARG